MCADIFILKEYLLNTFYVLSVQNKKRRTSNNLFDRWVNVLIVSELIDSFGKNLLSMYYVPDTTLDTKNSEKEQKEEAQSLHTGCSWQRNHDMYRQSQIGVARAMKAWRPASLFQPGILGEASRRGVTTQKSLKILTEEEFSQRRREPRHCRQKHQLTQKQGCGTEQGVAGAGEWLRMARAV